MPILDQIGRFAKTVQIGVDLSWRNGFEFVTLSLAILAHPHGLSEGMLFLPGVLTQPSVDLLTGHTLGFQTERFSDIGSFRSANLSVRPEKSSEILNGLFSSPRVLEERAKLGPQRGRHFQQPSSEISGTAGSRRWDRWRLRIGIFSTLNGICRRLTLNIRFGALDSAFAFQPCHHVKLCCESVPLVQAVGAAQKRRLRVPQLPGIQVSNLQ